MHKDKMTHGDIERSPGKVTNTPMIEAKSNKLANRYYCMPDYEKPIENNKKILRCLGANKYKKRYSLSKIAVNSQITHLPNNNQDQYQQKLAPINQNSENQSVSKSQNSQNLQENNYPSSNDIIVSGHRYHKVSKIIQNYTPKTLNATPTKIFSHKLRNQLPKKTDPKAKFLVPIEMDSSHINLDETLIDQYAHTLPRWMGRKNFRKEKSRKEKVFNSTLCGYTAQNEKPNHKNESTSPTILSTK